MTEKTPNPTFVYMLLVQLLLRFLRAEREGNWTLHLSAFAAMLPWFASRDVAPEELRNALLNAESRGKDKIKLFVEKRLKSQEVGFHDVIVKSNSPTLVNV